MWGLNNEKGWVPKNWCLWIVVLEKTLESPLDCKEVQAVHPKGDQSWVYIGRTDVEPETPILWPPDVNSWLIGKDPDAGKAWRQEEKGTTEDEMVGWHHTLDGHELEPVPGVGDGQGGLACCSPWGHKDGQDWAAEGQQRQRLNRRLDRDGSVMSSPLRAFPKKMHTRRWALGKWRRFPRSCLRRSCRYQVPTGQQQSRCLGKRAPCSGEALGTPAHPRRGHSSLAHPEHCRCGAGACSEERSPAKCLCGISDFTAFVSAHRRNTRGSMRWLSFAGKRTLMGWQQPERREEARREKWKKEKCDVKQGKAQERVGHGE